MITQITPYIRRKYSLNELAVERMPKVRHELSRHEKNPSVGDCGNHQLGFWKQKPEVHVSRNTGYMYELKVLRRCT